MNERLHEIVEKRSPFGDRSVDWSWNITGMHDAKVEMEGGW
jgi:hypothetical protein